MKEFVIVGEYDNKTYVYVSNTNPICWVDQLMYAKKYDSAIDAAHDICNEHQIYRTIVKCTDIKYISVLSLEDNKIYPIIDNNGDVIDQDEF